MRRASFLLSGIFLLLAMSSTTSAQIETNLPISNDGITIVGYEAYCPSNDEFNQEKLLLTLQNISPQMTKKVSWTVEVWLDNECVNCGNDKEYHYEFLLSPEESISGVCFDQNSFGLNYFIRFDDPETTITNKVTKLFFKNVTVQNIP